MSIDLQYQGGLCPENRDAVEISRLSDALDVADSRSFRSIAVVPANVSAVDFALMFSSGLESLVALYGPSGWGKSHILQVVQSRMAAYLGHPIPPVVPIDQWLNQTNAASHPVAAIIDDVDTCLESPKSRLRLRLALERRVKGGRPTLLAFGGECCLRKVRAALPSWRLWRIAEVGACHPAERHVILERIAYNEGLVLSEALMRLIANEIAGPASTMRGALLRLKAVQKDWQAPNDIVRACGTLSPFFMDNGKWDFCHHVVDLVARSGALESTPGVAAYLMLHVAQVSEPEAAAALGVTVGEVYTLAADVAEQVKRSSEARLKVDQLVRQLILQLSAMEPAC